VPRSTRNGQESKGELVEVGAGFNYSPLEPAVAKKVQAATEHIKETVKQTIEGIIVVGQDLIGVKEALPHGQFGPWLLAEFGWTERTARNFIAVAETFGPKTEMIFDLRIEPTAAYLLAAPSAPDEARQTAIERSNSSTLRFSRGGGSLRKPHPEVCGCRKVAIVSYPSLPSH
jgi:hypothetical protein